MFTGKRNKTDLKFVDSKRVNRSKFISINNFITELSNFIPKLLDPLLSRFVEVQHFTKGTFKFIITLFASVGYLSRNDVIVIFRRFFVIIIIILFFVFVLRLCWKNGPRKFVEDSRFRTVRSVNGLEGTESWGLDLEKWKKWREAGYGV